MKASVGGAPMPFVCCSWMFLVNACETEPLRAVSDGVLEQALGPFSAGCTDEGFHRVVSRTLCVRGHSLQIAIGEITPPEEMIGLYLLA